MNNPNIRIINGKEFTVTHLPTAGPEEMEKSATKDKPTPNEDFGNLLMERDRKQLGHEAIAQVAGYYGGGASGIGHRGNVEVRGMRQYTWEHDDEPHTPN